jgi:hypothetical protein
MSVPGEVPDFEYIFIRFEYIFISFSQKPLYNIISLKMKGSKQFS